MAGCPDGGRACVSRGSSRCRRGRQAGWIGRSGRGRAGQGSLERSGLSVHQRNAGGPGVLRVAFRRQPSISIGSGSGSAPPPPPQLRVPPAAGWQPARCSPRPRPRPHPRSARSGPDVSLRTRMQWAAAPVNPSSMRNGSGAGAGRIAPPSHGCTACRRRRCRPKRTLQGPASHLLSGDQAGRKVRCRPRAACGVQGIVACAEGRGGGAYMDEGTAGVSGTQDHVRVPSVHPSMHPSMHACCRGTARIRKHPVPYPQPSCARRCTHHPPPKHTHLPAMALSTSAASCTVGASGPMTSRLEAYAISP